MATSRPSFRSRARTTRPMPPAAQLPLNVVSPAKNVGCRRQRNLRLTPGFLASAMFIGGHQPQGAPIRCGGSRRLRRKTTCSRGAACYREGKARASHLPPRRFGRESQLPTPPPDSAIPDRLSPLELHVHARPISEVRESAGHKRVGSTDVRLVLRAKIGVLGEVLERLPYLVGAGIGGIVD